MGLDYHYDFAPRAIQQSVFRAQVQLACELRMPVVIHTREADEDTLAVLKEAGAGPEHIARMTWFVTSRDEYEASLRDIGAAWRELMGRVYPAMAVIIVSGLVERQAKVEIETTAVVPR